MFNTHTSSAAKKIYDFLTVSVEKCDSFNFLNEGKSCFRNLRTK